MQVKNNVILPYSADKIYNLVADIANYSKYLPWCTSTTVKEQTDNQIIGTIYIEYFKLKTQFTTKNTNTPFSKIEMDLVDGPFKEFKGVWNFISLGENGCKAEFMLNYKFSNTLLEKILGPVFGHISKNIVACFIKQAHLKYGG